MKIPHFLTRIAGVTLLFVVVLMGVSASASAAEMANVGASLPMRSDFTQGSAVHLTTAIRGGQYMLDSPTSTVRIYSRTSSFNLNIDGGASGCSENGDTGSVSTSFYVLPLDAAQNENEYDSLGNGYYAMPNSTSSNRQVASAPYRKKSADQEVIIARPSALGCGARSFSVSMAGGARVPDDAAGELAPYAGWYGIEVIAKGTGGAGWNMFKLSAPGTKISYYDAAGDHFAMKAKAGSGSGNFNLPFAPGCSLNSGSRTVKIKFFDLDVGASNQPGSYIQSYLYEFDENNNQTSRPAVSYRLTGGENVPYTVDIVVNAGKRYTFNIRGVNDNNGIQFELPYDSFNSGLDCTVSGADPTKSAGSCTQYKTDEDGSVRYRFSAEEAGVKAYDPTPTAPENTSSPKTEYSNPFWRHGVARDTDRSSRTYAKVSGVTLDTADGMLAGKIITSPFTSNYKPNGYSMTLHESRAVYLPAAATKTVTTYKSVKNAKGEHVRWDPVVTTSTVEYEQWATYAIPHNSRDITCFSAICEITGVWGDDFGAGRVSTRDATIEVRARISNPDYAGTNYDIQPLTRYFRGGGQLSLTATNGPNKHFLSLPIGVPGSRMITFDIPNPYYNYGGAPTSGSVTATPEYAGGPGRLGPDCTPRSYSVYVPYSSSTISANTTLSPSIEDPTSVTYNSQLCVNTRAPVYIDTTGTATYRRGATTTTLPIVSGGTYSSGCQNIMNIVAGLPAAMNPPAAGDEYCSSGRAQNTSGYLGPGGPQDRLDTAGDISTVPPRCAMVHNKPYVHVVNSDVKTDGDIRTYTGPSQPAASSRPRAIGSGAQFAARANGLINGFSSAILRFNSAEPLAAIGLSFSSTQNLKDAGLEYEGLGGNFGADYSMTDFYTSRSTEQGVTGSNASAITSFSDSKVRYDRGGATLTIGNGTPMSIGNGVNSVVLVDGDVYIRSNILMSTTWGSIADVPSLYIIAKGNIYIDPSVTQLDGVFIAQTRDGGRGEINTCAGVGGVSPANKLTGCGNQLVVYGAFNAKKVHLNRGYGSLRDSINGERLKGRSTTCQQGAGQITVGNGDCAAEIFIYTPEIYLANPGFVPTSGASSGIFDSITSLSPVL